MNRRDLLKTFGGFSATLTLGALLDSRNVFAEAPNPLQSLPPTNGGEPLPLFTALPYLQPGANGGPLPRAGQTDSIVVAWQTDLVPVTYSLECENGTQVTLNRVSERFLGEGEDGERVNDHSATITGLIPGKSYKYQLRVDGKSVFASHITARKGRGMKTRFVAFGDNSNGDISDRYIAHQSFLAKPDFLVNTGDVVYEDATVDEFARHFFPVHNADVAGPRIGAPLLRQTIVYPVIANHDIHGKDANKKPVADFDSKPDSLGYYTNFYLPTNGFKPRFASPIIGDAKAIESFKAAAGNRFPSQANYSYDNGDGHFLCLDSNVYVDPNDPELQAWVENDLKNTDAAWKVVVYHHPAYNVGGDHYTEQHMRVLSPLFEKHGVTIVLHGHEHNYQRTRPFHFSPKNPADASQNIGTKKRLVPGTFTIDRAFDGVTKTKPDGITYVTTGAGGKHLYDTDWNRRPDLWRHKEDDNADYIAAFVSDRHSLTVFEMDAKSLVLTQIDQWGRLLDKVVFTK